MFMSNKIQFVDVIYIANVCEAVQIRNTSKKKLVKQTNFFKIVYN